MWNQTRVYASEMEVPDSASVPLTPRLLSDKNPLDRDGSIQFLPDPHLYIYDGKPARKSVTKLVSNWFPEFNASKIINERFHQWQRSKTNKYSALCRYLQIVEGRDDDYCKGAIRALWEVRTVHQNACHCRPFLSIPIHPSDPPR